MKFESFATHGAVGKILAHSFISSNLKLSKGRSLTDDDIFQLTIAGISSLDVATLDSDDIDEREAAITIAEQLLSVGLYLDVNPSGRADLRASNSGLLLIDEQAINHCNLLCETVTITTRAACTRVNKDDRVASVKIIPYATQSTVVSSIVDFLKLSDDVISVNKFRALKIGLIQTEHSHQRDPLLDKTEKVIAKRLEPVLATIQSVTRCDHNNEALKNAIKDQINNDCDMLIVVGPTAIVDRNDLIPTAIKAAGGSIERYGMPVEPGHMLLLAYHGSIPIVGSPTCIRSRRDNGFDFLLDRFSAGMRVSSKDISMMGVGGLLG